MTEESDYRKTDTHSQLNTLLVIDEAGLKND